MPNGTEEDDQIRATASVGVAAGIGMGAGIATSATAMKVAVTATATASASVITAAHRDVLEHYFLFDQLVTEFHGSESRKPPVGLGHNVPPSDRPFIDFVDDKPARDDLRSLLNDPDAPKTRSAELIEKQTLLRAAAVKLRSYVDLWVRTAIEAHAKKTGEGLADLPKMLALCYVMFELAERIGSWVF